jgi:tRNA-dihydrouridine synthase B
MKPFNIRNITIDPPLILSPMAGVTDFTFRRLIKRRGGVGLVVSEFISVEGLTRHNPKTKRQMRFDEDERPFAVQIFGGQPERMAMGAEMAEEAGADILDVNCGCPAPKVVKNGGGSGLLREPARLETILKEIKRSISIPLTLKLRTGYTDASINVVDVAKMAEQCGVEHIQVHGRTREQGYKGLANWDLIKAVKENVSVPVSGNGDVTSIEYGMRKWREAGTDGILIGRGAMQNPVPAGPGGKEGCSFGIFQHVPRRNARDRGARQDEAACGPVHEGPAGRRPVQANALSFALGRRNIAQYSCLLWHAFGGQPFWRRNYRSR